METTVFQQIKELSRMKVGELEERYIEVFGEQTRSFHKDYLRKRIAWRIQALAEGDLSERARRRAEELVNAADLRIRSLSAIAQEVTGTKWNGFLFFGIADNAATRQGSREAKRSYK